LLLFLRNYIIDTNGQGKRSFRSLIKLNETILRTAYTFCGKIAKIKNIVLPDYASEDVCQLDEDLVDAIINVFSRHFTNVCCCKYYNFISWLLKYPLRSNWSMYGHDSNSATKVPLLSVWMRFRFPRLFLWIVFTWRNILSFLKVNEEWKLFCHQQ
jgi:hypothetical protein